VLSCHKDGIAQTFEQWESPCHVAKKIRVVFSPPNEEADIEILFRPNWINRELAKLVSPHLHAVAQQSDPIDWFSLLKPLGENWIDDNNARVGVDDLAELGHCGIFHVILGFQDILRFLVTSFSAFSAHCFLGK